MTAQTLIAVDPAELQSIRDRLDAIASLLARIEPEPELWDTKRAAKHYRVTEKTIRAWVAEGKLPAIRKGARMFFRPADLVEQPG